MKTIIYGPRPAPKPQKSWAEQICDEILHRYSIELLENAIEILKARRDRLVGSNVPQSESPAPANTQLVKIGSKSVVEAPTRRPPGRPRKRRWTAERHEAHRLRKEKRIEEIRNNPRAQALMAAIGGKPAFGLGVGKPAEQVDATYQPSNVT